MSLGSRAASWFASFTFVLAVLCQRIQTLGTRIAFAIDYPSGVGLYPRLVASRGLPRPRPRGGALYIGDAALGATEKFLLFSAMRTPGSAVEFGVGAGEMFRQAADPRIFRTRRFAYIPCVVKMKRDDNDQGRAHRFAEPRAPRKAGQMSGLLEKQGDEKRRQQPQRSQAIGTSGLQGKKGDGGQVYTVQEPNNGDEPSKLPLAISVFVPGDDR